MGASSYCYFTAYSADLETSLQLLRLREFQAGRYDPALQSASPPSYTFEQQFPPGPNFPSPGAKHRSIDAAIEAAGEDGTGSILNIFGVSATPQPFFASPLPLADVQKLFGTREPNRLQVSQLIWDQKAIMQLPDAERSKRVQLLSSFWDSIDRAEARIITVYESGPALHFWAGVGID